MAIMGNLPAFATTPKFIGGAVIVILAVIGGLWWLYKTGKLTYLE